METRIFLRRDNSIPSVAKSGENGWKSNNLPFIAVSAQQKKILNYRETMAQLHAGQGTTRQILSWLITVS